jgi:cytochrome b6-f complex iron-sulfur subunit
MGVLLFAIGLTEAQQARFYAPQPVAPVQYTNAGGYATYASAPALDAPQPMYVSAMPVAETSTGGRSILSGIAFVAGLAVTSVTLAHHVQKKATKHHHHSRPKKSRPSDINRKAPEYPPIPDIPWMTKIEKKVAALATGGQESWDDAVVSPWSPLTTYEHFLEETDVEKKIAMLATADGFVPDMQRRTIMNLVLLGGAAVPVAWLGGGFVYFFIPPSGGGGGGGLVAKDANGDDVTTAGWTKSHPFPERSLVQGLKGDAHYLIVQEDGKIRDYALNAVCTHLGCVVPWNRAANKFMCPCHGSQYDQTGKVVRGPAPLSLALAHVNESESGKVELSPWTETDFRTDTPPWWKA